MNRSYQKVPATMRGSVARLASAIGQWAVCAVLVSAAVTARSGDAWQTLPATPELPAETNGHYTTINGAKIWHAEWNKAAAGIPVLLLHGGYANSNYFGNLIPVLVRHGYYVIAMDSRGHGRSTRTDDPYSYHLMGEDVIKLLDALNVRAVQLVGWSDGGCIGYDLALHHPKRLSRLFAFGADADLSGIKDNVDKNPVFAEYLDRAAIEYHQLSPTPNDWSSFNAAVNKMWESQPNFTSAELRHFRVPVTIADGQYDEGIKPEHLQYLVSTIPGAKLVIIPDTSHFAMLQNPDAFGAAVLAFLQRQ